MARKGNILAGHLTENTIDQSWHAEPFASLKTIIWSGFCNHIIPNRYDQRYCMNGECCDVGILIYTALQSVSIDFVEKFGLNCARVSAPNHIECKCLKVD